MFMGLVLCVSMRNAAFRMSISHGDAICQWERPNVRGSNANLTSLTLEDRINIEMVPKALVSRRFFIRSLC